MFTLGVLRAVGQKSQNWIFEIFYRTASHLLNCLSVFFLFFSASISDSFPMTVEDGDDTTERYGKDFKLLLFSVHLFHPKSSVIVRVSSGC